MKRFVICLSTLWITLLSFAQSVVSFGARGGLDFMLPKSEQTIKSKLGVAGAFDIGYTHYWPVGFSELGFHTGISVGYASNESQIELYQQYTNYDYMYNEMLYTTAGKVYVMLKRAYAELPLMLAYRSNGFVMQFGAKVQYSFWSTASQKVGESSIDAYYVPFDVHVTDELVTGVVGANDKNEKKIDGGAPTLNVLSAMQIGYESKVGNRGRIGVAAYIDYNVWNNQSLAHIDQPLIAVAPITNPQYPVPAVTVNNAFNTVISRVNPLQIGVSVYYAIEFETNHYYSGNRHRHVRSNMRYRPYRPQKSNRYRPYYSIHGRR